MEKFTKISSVITPFDKANVDTDQIIPKQFLKLIQKTGFGKYLFYNWRFDSDGNPKTDFILNESKYANSKILVTTKKDFYKLYSEFKDYIIYILEIKHEIKGKSEIIDFIR